MFAVTHADATWIKVRRDRTGILSEVEVSIPSRLRLVCLLAFVLAASACSAPTPEKLLADARAAVTAGEPRTAEIHLKNLLQRSPDNAEARALLGSVLLAEGQLAAAEDSLRRARQLGSDPVALRVPLATVLVEQSKFDAALEVLAQQPDATGVERLELLRLEGLAQRGLRAYDSAEAAYRRALEIEPRSSQLRTELASVLAESGRAKDADELIAAVLADEPGYAPALLARGMAEMNASKFVAAESTFQQVVDSERGKGARSLDYLTALAQLVQAQLAQGKVEAAAPNADTLLTLAPKNPIARYVKAAVEVQQQNLDGAEQRLESLIADVPSYWPAHRLLGAINVKQNQLGQAVMYLRTAVTNNPTDTAARLQLAELYIRQGDLAAARELVQASPGMSVDDGLFYAFAGRTSQQAGLPDQAARYFEESERQAGGDVRELATLSSLYLSAGEFERAARVLESASLKDAQSEQLADYLLALVQARQGDLKAADATAQRLVRQVPAAAWPLNLRAALAMSGGDLPLARELLGKSRALEPMNTATLVALARVALAEQKPEEAEGLLRRASEIDPNDQTALVGLAQLIAARGDFANATRQVERLPTSPIRDRLFGELSQRQGKFADAAASFKRAYEARPSSELAILTYGAANRAGLPEPDAQLRAWSSLNPRDPAANYALGAIALEKADPNQALRRFEAVYEVNQNHAPTLNNLAWLYGERRDPRALERAERAYSLAPKNPSIADTLGWLYVQNGAPDKGLPLLATAAAALPRQGEVVYHWGVALAETGDTAKALETLKSAVASGVDFPGRDDAQKRLAKLTAAPR
jgi:predicted Zn-dependent protease